VIPEGVFYSLFLLTVAAVSGSWLWWRLAIGAAKPAALPAAQAPRCCEDADEGRMVQDRPGVWLCIWCGREVRLAAASAAVVTCDQCETFARELPDVTAEAVDQFHARRHLRPVDTGCDACDAEYYRPGGPGRSALQAFHDAGHVRVLRPVLVAAPVITVNGTVAVGMQYHSREPAPPPPPPWPADLAPAVPRAVPPPGRPPAPPPNIRRHD